MPPYIISLVAMLIISIIAFAAYGLDMESIRGSIEEKQAALEQIRQQISELMEKLNGEGMDSESLGDQIAQMEGSIVQIDSGIEALNTALAQVDSGMLQMKDAAALLSQQKTMARYYSVDKVKQGEIFNSLEKCCKYLVQKLQGRRNETVFILCMDAKCKMICCKEVGEGSVNSASIPVRRIVEIALGVNATTVVLAHNHPSGLALPSGEDIQTTRRIALALDAVDITLADHIVVADDDYVSLVQSGYYLPGEARVII